MNHNSGEERGDPLLKEFWALQMRATLISSWKRVKFDLSVLPSEREGMQEEEEEDPAFLTLN